MHSARRRCVGQIFRMIGETISHGCDVEPVFDFVREDPRFQEMVRRLNIPQR